jgi:hypothetical protein
MKNKNNNQKDHEVATSQRGGGAFGDSSASTHHTYLHSLSPILIHYSTCRISLIKKKFELTCKKVC